MMVFFLHAVDNAFVTSRKQSLLIKKIISEEESIARAYEQYLLDKKSFPTYDQLKSDDYLSTSFITTFFDTAKSISISSKSITNRLLLSELKDNINFKKLYESNIFRKKTYINRSNKIEVFLEDDFAKHLYYLIRKSGSAIPNCLPSTDESQYCIENNHLKVYSNKIKSTAVLLMYYHVDNFRLGPIIITNQKSLHTNSEFKSIPTGAILYDTDAIKYIKTFDSIEVLK
jgi:hypothetical protein